MGSELNDAELERLSAFVDGELDGTHPASMVCTAWRESVELRASWHAYQLIGDVLRSDDLACDARAETAFLAGFRARMASEPVVLAPQPVALPAGAAVRVANGMWRSWRLPSAVAAGMVAVVGLTLLPRAPNGDPGGAVPIASTALPVAQAVPALAVADETQAFVANGQMIRDSRLDRYLAAHKQFAGSTALGIPSGFLRNATAVESDAGH